MNLYKFDYDGWGEYYFVMSEDPITALQAIKDYMKGRADKAGQFATNMHGDKYVTGYWESWEMWDHASLNNLPEKYTLKVFEPNVVEEGEYS